MNETKAALYIRVSSQEQAREGYSIGEQEERLRAYAKARDWHVIKAFVDPGFTGGNIDRPALQEMIRLINEGAIDTVCVYKLDRLSRKQKDTLYLIEDVMLKNEVNFVSITESLDTSTPYGRMMIGILSAFAQLEHEVIRERIMMGLEGRAKKGLWKGATAPEKTIRGYDFVDSRLVVNEYEAAAVRMIFDMYEKGKGVPSIFWMIQEKFPGLLKAESTVANILDNPTYCGRVKFRDEVYEGQHESIISVDQYSRVQELRTKRRTGNSAFGNNRTRLLSGLLYCGECGNTMVGANGNKNKDGIAPMYYACKSRTAKRHLKRPCNKKHERRDPIDDRIIARVKSLTLNDVKVIADDRNAKHDTSGLLKELGSIDKQIDKLIELYTMDLMPIEQLNGKMEQLRDKKSAIEKSIREMTDDEAVILKRQNAALSIERVAGFDWDGSSTAEKRALLSDLIDRIVITNEELHIHWNF